MRLIPTQRSSDREISYAIRLIKNGTRNEDYVNFDAGADTSPVITISFMSFRLRGAE
jgi:hypothetical protein